MDKVRDAAPKQRQASCRLEPADILLVHTRHSLWGRIIRLGTHCYWNHAMMVCSVGDTGAGPADATVVDARTDGSISLRKAGDYLSRPEKYDVAVMRYDADWFQDRLGGRGHDIRGRICSIALDQVDSRIGQGLFRRLDQIVRQCTVILRFVRRRLRIKHASRRLPWTTRPAQFKAFTCGGLVQWCYYTGVSHALRQEVAAPARLRDVIFNPRIHRSAAPFELLTTTPADLANCRKLSWKYIVKGGDILELPA